MIRRDRGCLKPRADDDGRTLPSRDDFIAFAARVPAFAGGPPDGRGANVAFRSGGW